MGSARSGKKGKKDESRSERPETGQYREEVNSLFFEAVEICLGPSYRALAEEDGNQMLMCSAWRTSGDWQSNCCIGFFRQHVVELNKQRMHMKEMGQGDDAVLEPPTRRNDTTLDSFKWPPVTVTTTSTLGLVSERTFSSPPEMAQAIIDVLPEAGRTRLIADARVTGKAGRIILTTRAHLEWHLIMGRLPCALCGLFAKGARGLRMHQMEAHGLDYEPAQAEAKHVSETQLIVFAADAQARGRWADEAAAVVAARDAMDIGLECCRSGDLVRLQELVDSGRWDPHTARDRNGCSALNWAAGEGNLSMVRFLIEDVGVDTHVLTGKPKRKRHSLHWAARNGREDVCQYLIFEQHTSPDVATEDGTTPLHYACMMSKVEMAQWLVDVAGANPNALNSFGCNASQWCALAGCVPLIRMLKTRGLDLGVLNRNGHSVLHKAAIKGQGDAIEYLIGPKEEGGLELGLEYMRPDSDGFTPISFARANHYPALAKRLVEHEQRLLEKQREQLMGAECLKTEEEKDAAAAAVAAAAAAPRWTTDEEDFADGILDTNELSLF